MYNKPIISKGKVLFYKGRKICEAVIDCWPGDPMTIDQFHWYDDKPKPGDAIHPAIIDYLNAHIEHVVKTEIKVNKIDYNEGR